MLEERFAAPVLEAYAMTEASHQITSSPLPPASHPPGSVGIPRGDIKIRIVGAEGGEVASGDEGEVCVRSPGVMTGYLSNPAHPHSLVMASFVLVIMANGMKMATCISQAVSRNSSTKVGERSALWSSTMSLLDTMQ